MVGDLCTTTVLVLVSTTTVQVMECKLLVAFQKVCSSCAAASGLLASHVQVRGMPSTKHYDPKWRKQRREKFLKVLYHMNTATKI